MNNARKYLIIGLVFISISLAGLILLQVPGLFGQTFSRGSSACGRGGNFWGKSQSDASYDMAYVKARAEEYLEGYEGLEIVEIMEFSDNFYIEVSEADTGVGAMELLMDKRSGRIMPEYGPNMMWNLKYGMHRRTPMSRSGLEMEISEEEAVELANSFLERKAAGETAQEAEKYYGYYTIHTVTDSGQIAGMLSVNGYTGDVWYHNWHGVFVDMVEY
ncbi:MAG: hypothetical protein ACQEP5_05280 [Actinomycetota bacterium]